MRGYLRISIWLCSLLPVVLPCIFASELFLFDSSKDTDSGVKRSAAAESNEKYLDGAGMSLDEARKVQQDWLDRRNKEKNSEKEKQKWNVGFLHAFAASISVIIVSELGDKTFFIAAIMAMRHARSIVFLGAIGALALMTVLASFLGYATTVIPRKYTFYISTALFAIFGLKMLKEGYEMDPNHGQEEYEEVSVELKRKDEELEKQQKSGVIQDMETGIIRDQSQRKRWYSSLFSPTLLQSFTMTFLAEWGDRSQLTTIILASRDDPFGVTLGGIIGHAICTGLAVLGGRLIAQRISVRTVTLIGGVVFILFAVSAFFFDPNQAVG